MQRESCWAVILAGGDGNRLRTLTRHLSGDDRPKQFCRLAGARSLLAETMQRVAPIVTPDRTLCVVSKRHESFYRAEMSGVRRWQVLEQTASRGTTAAVAFAIAAIQLHADRDSAPIVGFLPADHYYTNPVIFRRALSLAYATAAQHRDRVVILGASATTPETEYGWIQPGPRLDEARLVRRTTAAREVVQFWEKPSAEVAADLLRRRCLWNTFLSVGRADAFARLLADAVPDVWSPFAHVIRRGQRSSVNDLSAVYSTIASSDLSRDVLARYPGRLAVLDLPSAAGWSDLGHPGRALEVLARHNLPRPALRWAPGQMAVAAIAAPLGTA